MSPVKKKPSSKKIIIPAEKRKKMPKLTIQGNDPSKEHIISDHKSSERQAMGQDGTEQNNRSLISPEVRSVASTPASTIKKKTKGFVEVALEMINYLSEAEPDLVGWGDDNHHFYVNNHKNLDKFCQAMKPFFDHGNFSSFRRQLSAYHFSRMPAGKYQGYWYHPRFHRSSNEQDLRDIQASRRRRCGRSSSSKTPKSTEPLHRNESSKVVQSRGGLGDAVGHECVQTLIFDSLASLFPLASLAKDEVLNGGFVESEKDDTSQMIMNSQKEKGLESIERHPLSGFVSCTPIKPTNVGFPVLRSVFSPPIFQGTVIGFVDYSEGIDTPMKPANTAVPILRSAFSPQLLQGTATGFVDNSEGIDTPMKPANTAVPILHSAFSPQLLQGTATGLVDNSEGNDSNKENSTFMVEQGLMNSSQVAFEQYWYSPTVPANHLFQHRRASPFGYDYGLAQWLYSPNRQRPGVTLPDCQTPITFSFRGNLPATDVTSPTPNAPEPKKPTEDRLDSNNESEIDAKPAAVNPNI